MKELYPNKQLFKTSKTVTDIQMDIAKNESSRKKGIFFYCGKRHTFVFIPNVKEQ